jgi:hypothetical protein
MKSIKKLLFKKHKNKYNYILTKKKYKSKFNKSNYNLNGGVNPISMAMGAVGAAGAALGAASRTARAAAAGTTQAVASGARAASRAAHAAATGATQAARAAATRTMDAVELLIVNYIKTKVNLLFSNNTNILAIIDHIISNNLITLIRLSIINIPHNLKGVVMQNKNVIKIDDINTIIDDIITKINNLNIIKKYEIPDITIIINSESSNTDASSNTVSHANTLYSIVYNTLEKTYNDFFQYLQNNSGNKLNIFYYLIYSIIIQSKLIGIKSPELINIIIYILDIFKKNNVKININNSNGNPDNLIDVVHESIIKKSYIDIEDIDTIFLIINIIIDKYKDILCIKTSKHIQSSQPLNLILVLCYSIQDIYIAIKYLLNNIIDHKFIRVTKINAYIKNINIDADIKILLSLKLHILINSIDIIPDSNQKYKISNLHINIKDIIKTIILIFFTDNTINYNELLNIDTILFTDNNINYDEIINNITLYDLLKVINAFLNKHNNFIYCIFSIIENILTKQLKDIFKIKINSNNGNSSANTVLYGKITKYIKNTIPQLNMANTINSNESIYDKLSIEFIITELINIIKSNIAHITVEYKQNLNDQSEFVIRGINLCNANNNEISNN